MNVDANPASATYDSLSDAYLADGNRLRLSVWAERALEFLAADTRAPEEFKQAIRAIAERTVKELRRRGRC